MSFKPYQVFPIDAALKIVGNVKTVLDGSVKESCMEEHVLDCLAFALGAGSFADCSCIGETIVLNQIGYISRVNDQADLITNHDTTGLKSPFLVGIEKGEHPAKILQINYQEGIILNELFERMGESLHGYAFVGYLLFETLSCSYLKQPPIFNEPINENVEKYWATTENHPNCYAYVFGVVIKEKGKDLFPKEVLQRAFYVNPLEKNQGGILSHTHAALVKTPPSFTSLKKDLYFYKNLEPSLVTGVRHIFTHSIVKEGLLALFDVTEIR